MIYIAGRLGTSQQILIDTVAEELRSAQADGSVRAGDARELAAMVLLITQSTIQSGQIVEPILDAESLSTELTRARTDTWPDARPDRPQRRPPRRRPGAAVAGGGLVDVLVIGGGITGAGIALDAASRGLTAVLVEKHDRRSAPAAGVGSWCTGLRYLATGNVGIARRSAVERGILMTRNAPTSCTPCRNWSRCWPTPVGETGAGAHRVRGRRRAARSGGHEVIGAAALPPHRRRRGPP